MPIRIQIEPQVRQAKNMRRYPEGYDVVWLGADRNARVAAFITGGCGPIPATLFESALPDLTDLEDLILTMPVRARSELLVSVPHPDSFIELSGRGLYVFDWTDLHRAREFELGAYELVSRPLEPLSASLLPESLRAVANAAHFTHSSFDLDHRINVHAFCEVKIPKR